MRFWERWAGPSLGFDRRSLALLRVLAPSVYLWELLSHWRYLEAYCTDGGLLPRCRRIKKPGNCSLTPHTVSSTGLGITEYML